MSHKGKWYEPTWEDLDSRPLPEWFDRAKIGIFVHWGVYSVPAIYTEWIWYRWKTDVKYMKRNFKPNFTYEEFAPFFKAQLFDPHEWARLFAKSGAKYVVFTSKHHDGYAMFPSKQSPGWNSVDVGPRRDIVGDLGAAVRLKGLRYGLYYSLYEWYNPDYLWDKSKRFTTSKYVDRKLWPDVKQLVNDYKPSIVWFDGHWEAPHTYFNTTRILSWLYNESPVKEYVVVNDRLGKGESCHHGDFFNCKDKYMPRALVKHKWETCLSLDLASWGYRTNMQEDDVMSVNTMFKLLIQTISNGGNFLINIGPTKDGVIVPIFRKRLLELGKWLETNGEAVYNSSPWLYQQDRANKEVFYTCVKA
ncbi:tissue alpha-L-fucosidase-like, partial [Pectinophora gossypiella]|uniref:tissue alpha-L-fucosidase-like n=1 Tax=Pectinophora gossypiella TaxID=13191 RepID=UPI00214DF92B